MATPVPYLAEAVPQLNTDAWRVNPDGTMETRYRLKPNITWYDGQPLTADDFVFAEEVYTEPALAANTTPPGSLIGRVTAPTRGRWWLSGNRPTPMRMAARPAKAAATLAAVCSLPFPGTS